VAAASTECSLLAHTDRAQLITKSNFAARLP
jgi:hypothetical protein